VSARPAAAPATLLAGCAGGTGAEGSAAPPAPEARTLAEYAAASLTEVFGELEPRFEEAVNAYPTAVIAPGADLARAFQGLVTGAEGRAVLGSAGFGSP
jgi:ABC-type molybdate transport system substrate-binding protein